VERKIYYLYLIKDLLNEKVYVGQTVRPKERWSQHRSHSKNNPIQYIHLAIAKYGVQNFQFETVASCTSQEDADCVEIELIQQYDSCNKENGYNISSGGDPAWNRGLPKEQQPMYGKRQSEHQKQRCSETHTGKKFFHTPKTKSKITKSLTGKIQSKETIENKSGEKSGRSKISGIDVRNIRNEIKYCTALELSIKYGISEASIWNIIGGKTWKSSKYKNEMTHYQWIDMIFKRIGLKRNAV